jgi:hypothetical protein
LKARKTIRRRNCHESDRTPAPETRQADHKKRESPKPATPDPVVPALILTDLPLSEGVSGVRGWEPGRGEGAGLAELVEVAGEGEVIMGQTGLEWAWLPNDSGHRKTVPEVGNTKLRNTFFL